MSFARLGFLVTFGAIVTFPAHAELTDQDWAQPAMASYEKCVEAKARSLLPSGEPIKDLVNVAIYTCRDERLEVSFAIIKSAERQLPKLSVEQRSPVIGETNKLVDHDIICRVMLRLIETKALSLAS